MSTRSEAKRFLDDFFVKYRTFDIVFMERVHPKNVQTLLVLEISPSQRRQVIEAISVDDYISGPLPDTLYHISDMWVFGKTVKKREIYIKISLGRPGSQVICISFHIAERLLHYPFKSII
nr:hypothetical protein [uncultured Dyadobacter sp.]